MSPQQVDLVVRELGEGFEQVIEVRVGDRILELPANSEVKVVHEAGPDGAGAQVHVVLLAGRVRYVDRSEVDAEAPGPVVSPEEMARRFHEAYERLAPDFDYKTRERSAVPWDDVPEDNKRLMVATAAAVLGR